MSMNLLCLNDIITEDLAIHIDLSKLNSWNLNTGLTAVSLCKWNGVISSNIDLIDFGLTEFDNGRTNKMYEGITVLPSDTKFTAYRVGYNVVENPTTGETSGSTITTKYDLYPISAVTSSVGSYFELNGGYLQGYFKLPKYSYELLPSRYSNGITIETLVNIHTDSKGIFFMIGTRAEDKYNSYFSGETRTGITKTGNHKFEGVTTSDENYLMSLNSVTGNKKAFSKFEEKEETKFIDQSQNLNISNNVIAFELTEDKRLGYRYIDENGNLNFNSSPKIITTSDWSIISISFIPNEPINEGQFNCAPRRKGKLVLYVNGRAHWIITDFPEFYFGDINTNRNLQIGVPYSISWGGGSFGLRHSWHYDNQKYCVYVDNDETYVSNNFLVESNPFPTQCDPYSGGTQLTGLSLSADTSSFYYVDNCNSTITYSKPVMRIMHTGTTGNTYFIKFNQAIKALSNRDYVIDLSIFNDGFFKTYSNGGSVVINKVSVVVYGTVDIDVINDIEYVYPINGNELINLSDIGYYPFPDKQQFEYISDGVMYYGVTGMPVERDNTSLIGNSDLYNSIQNAYVTGEMGWKPMKLTFRTKNNSGAQTVYIGLLIETNYEFNLNSPLYIKDFTYSAADILVQDTTKDNLMIEENFNNSFIGGMQKLRVYNKGLTSQEILHNALIESTLNPSLNLVVSNGGRIISKYTNYISGQQAAGSDIRKSIKYRNVNGTYKNLDEMIDIMVVVKSRVNPNNELVRFKKAAVTTGSTTWLALIPVDIYTYDFIVPDEITTTHANEILYAEIKFQWADPDDIDNIFEKIAIVNISTKLLENTIKNY